MSASEEDSIDKRARFDFVRYSNLWEDADILCAALAPSSGKRILSIMSAGDNALALAAEGAEVLAVDLNPAQQACAELKCLAIRKLEHEDVLAFFGVTESHRRVEVFNLLKGDLSASTRQFWSEREALVAEGFIHCGKFERYFQLFRRRVLPLVASRSKVEALFAPRSREERHAFYTTTWSTWRWRLMFHMFFSRTVMGALGRDPEFFRYVEGSVGGRILTRARHGLTDLAPHENPYLHYIFMGNYGRALPRFLRADIFPKVRAALEEGRVRFELGGIDHIAAREALAARFHGFNLSDIFEYVDESATHHIYETLLTSAHPGARLAYWNMLVPRECPTALKHRIRSLESLSAELFARDNAVFYSAFRVEEVV